VILAEINASIKHRDATALAELIEELRSLADPERRADIAASLGTLHWFRSELPEALQHLKEAAQQYEAEGRLVPMASMLSSIGNLYSQIGDYPLALEHLHQALEILERSDRLYDVAVTASGIGSIAELMGELDAARTRYEQALTILTDLQDRSGVANVMSNLGGLHLRRHEYEQAQGLFTEAASILHEVGDRESEARVLGNLVSLYLEQEEFAQAQRTLEQQQDLECGSASTLALMSRHHARLLEVGGALDESRDILLQALHEAERIHRKDLEATLHLDLRENARLRGDMAAYVEHNAAYLQIKEETAGADAIRSIVVQAKQRELDEIQREQERERAVLYSTLPRNVADRILQGEDVSGDEYPIATVLYLDIVDFTQQTDALDAHVTSSFLDRIYASFDAICETHHLTKIKTIGDCYLAVAFPEGSDHRAGIDATSVATVIALRTALAAMEMQSIEMHWPNGAPVRYRIGIHMGSVTAGVIGTQQRQYDVWGEAVNIAGRLEHTSEPGRIQVSESFAQGLGYTGEERSEEGMPAALAPRPYSIAPRGAIEINGKGSMTTYWLEPL